MTIPFLIYSLLSLPLHFGLKKLVSSAFVSILVVISATILTFFIFFGSGNYLYDGHILSTILTIVVMIITIYEFISLERHVINLKMGLSDNTKNIPVETEYKFVLSVLGFGLGVLFLANITGFIIYDSEGLDLSLKITSSILALLIYIGTFLAVKSSLISSKNALRFLLLTFLLIIISYFLTITILSKLS